MEKLTIETKKNVMEDFFCSVGGSDLLKWLEEKGFYEEPASKAHHGAEPGALFDHSLQVTYELVNLTGKLGLKWQRKESPQIVGMLHDVCKMDDYLLVKEYEEIDTTTFEGPAVKKIETGCHVEWNKQRELPGHGSKSLIMLLGHITLTEEEKACIMFHMGAFTDSSEWEFYSRAVKKYPNVLYTQTADMIASQIKGV